MQDSLVMSRVMIVCVIFAGAVVLASAYPQDRPNEDQVLQDPTPVPGSGPWGPDFVSDAARLSSSSRSPGPDYLDTAGDFIPGTVDEIDPVTIPGLMGEDVGTIDEAPGPINEAPGPINEAPGPINENIATIDNVSGPMDEAPGPNDEAPGPTGEAVNPIFVSCS